MPTNHPKKRGRPRKHPLPDPSQPKRPPGRPRKHPKPEEAPPPFPIVAEEPPPPAEFIPPLGEEKKPLVYSNDAKRGPGRPPKEPGPNKLRPPKRLLTSNQAFTKKVAEEIVLSVQRGNSLHVAALLQGIHIATLKSWLKRGGDLNRLRIKFRRAKYYAKARGDKVGYEHAKAELARLATDKHNRYAAFVRKVRQAQAEFKDNVVQAILQHGEDDWKALQYVLEHFDPKHFGRQKVQHEHKMSGKIEHQHTHVQAHFTPDDLQKIPLEHRKTLLELIRSKRGEESAVIVPALPAPEAVVTSATPDGIVANPGAGDNTRDR